MIMDIRIVNKKIDNWFRWYNPRLDLQPGDQNRKIETVREIRPGQAVVFNGRTGRVVGGHQRLKILRERLEECRICCGPGRSS